MKDFDNLVAERCNKALTQNREYMEMEKSGTVSPDIIQAKAEVLCYKQCLKDVLTLLICSNCSQQL